MSLIRNCPLTLVVLLSALCLTLPSLSLVECRVRGANNRLAAADLSDMLAAGDGASRIRVGQPRRPDSFRTIDELNQYLAEMRQYYSMLGRPR